MSVFRRIKRIAGAFIHAPDRFDDLAGRIRDNDVSLRAEQQKMVQATERVDHLDEEQEKLRAAQETLRSTQDQMRAAQEQMRTAQEQMRTAQGQLQAIQEQMQTAQSRMSGTLEIVYGLRDDYVYRMTEQITRNRSAMDTLNRESSVHRTVWGEPKKLHIDPTAAMDTCLFNVNSGEITVGAYSFAGPRVSLLAGSHDTELKGYLRRDAEITSGCDITVGRGVWLAAGCMLLGPCTIGDDAVIAAGAVVTPGTDVPAGTIWGGVPARQIGETGAGEQEALLRALKREDGILFTHGWSEKTMFEGILKPVRRMEENGAVLLTTRKRAEMIWGLDGTDRMTLVLTGSGSEERILLEGKSGEKMIELPCAGETAEEVKLETDRGTLYIRLETEKAKEGDGET